MASPRTALSAVLATALVAAGLVLTPTAALADPAAPANASDALVQLTDLGHQAEVLTEQMHDAQITLDTANTAKAAAATSLAGARTDLAAANAQVGQFRGTVDQLAQASYQGARLNGLSALMTSASPQDLLDQMSSLDLLATDTSSRLVAFQGAQAKADTATGAAQQASDQAKAAASSAAATTAKLRRQQQQLTAKTTKVKAAFDALDAAEKAAYVGTSVPVGYTAPTAPAAAPTSPTAPAAASTSATAPAAASTSTTAPAASTSTAAPAVAPSGSGVGFAALQAALSKVGSPYVWGATGPGTFDCSGLTSWAYTQAGVSIPRSSRAQAGSGTPVSQGDLQPGDLVFFYSPISHVGLYAGDGMVVHSPTFGQGVKVSPMSQMPFSGARRY